MKTYKTVHNLSDRLVNLLPDYVREESPEFVAFLDAYFDFLESDILTLESQGELQTLGLEDGSGSIVQETETAKPTPMVDNKFTIWDGANLDLSNTQPFEIGEYLVGKTSGALAKIKVINDKVMYLDMITDYNFKEGEQVLGRTSNQTGKVKTHRQNSILANNKLLDYSDIDRTTEEFLAYFQKDFMPSIDFLIEADKKLIIKHIKDLYKTKGTKESLEFLFRILYKENAEVVYPIDNTIHVSDSGWKQKNFVQVRMDEPRFQPPSNGKIVQKDSLGNKVAEAVIEGVFLDPNSEINYKVQISDFHFGDFTVDGSIEVENRDTKEIQTGILRGVISGATTDVGYSNTFKLEDNSGDLLLEDGTGFINEDDTATLGSLYTLTDNVIFESGKGDDATDATGQVDGLTAGSVTEVYISEQGDGFADGDLIIFDNAGTGGSGALGRVEAVGDIMLSESGVHFGHFEYTAVNGQTVFSGLDDNNLFMAFDEDTVRIDVNGVTKTEGFTINDNLDTVTFTTGLNGGDFVEIFGQFNSILAEDGTPLTYDSVDGQAAPTGIRKVTILNQGAGYNSLPVAAPGGYIYMSATHLSGFQVGETITGAGGGTGKIVYIDNDKNRLEVQRRPDDSGAFVTNETVTGQQSSAAGTITQHNVPSGTNAKVLAYSTSIGGVGSLRMTEVGNKYNTHGRVKSSSTFPMLITSPTSVLARGTTITGSTSGATGIVIDYNTTTSVLKFKDLTGYFKEGERLTFTGGTSKVAKFNPIRAMGNFVGEAIEDGNFANDYGYIDAAAMNIFDSKYYQTHSYVVKVGESINKWRSIVKNLIHPAGHIFFGEVAIRTNVNATADVYNRTFDSTETTRAFIPTLIIGSKVDSIDLLWEDETWNTEDDNAVNNYYPIELEDTLHGKLKAERYINGIVYDSENDVNVTGIIDQVTGQGYVIGTTIDESDDSFVSRILEVEAKINSTHKVFVIMETREDELNDAIVLREAGIPTATTDPRTDGVIKPTTYDVVSVSNPAGAKSGAFTEIGDSSHRARHLNVFMIKSFASVSSQVGLRQEGGVSGNLAKTSLSIDFNNNEYQRREDLVTGGSFRSADKGKVFQFDSYAEEFLIMEDGFKMIQEPVDNFLVQEPPSNEFQQDHVDDEQSYPNQAHNQHDGDGLLFENATTNLNGDNIGNEKCVLEDATVTIRDEYFVSERSLGVASTVSSARLGPTLRSINIISNQRAFDIAYYIHHHGDDDAILLENEGGKIMDERSNLEGLRVQDLNDYYSSFLVPDFEEKANRKSNITLSSYVSSG